MRRRAHSVERYALLPLLLAALVAAVAAPAASAAPKKPYEVALSPAVVSAGVTEDAYSIMLTNRSQTQQLGSADVTAPPEFTLEGDPHIDSPRTATVAGNVISLRNLSLPPDGSVTVTIGVRMPCVSRTYSWGFQAKQSNDFSGTPGNDLGPILGSQTTMVNGKCRLRFVAQPEDTEKNQSIRAVRFNPASDQLVSVEAIDGRTDPADPPERLTWFDEQQITMALAPTTYFGRLDPSGTTATTHQGLATFPALRIDAAGVYNLVPDTNAAGFDAGPASFAFTIVDVAEECTSASCTAKLSGGIALTRGMFRSRPFWPCLSLANRDE